jgi:Ribbon-helix-helix protein, copG family
MSATRTQVYLTEQQRTGLDERARVERKTMAHVIRDAVDSYLADGVDDAGREWLLADTFGAVPAAGERAASRDEWDRRVG